MKSTLRFILFTFVLSLQYQISYQCPCYNGGTCFNDNCQCAAGWTGKNCQRPCVDYYKSCKGWDEEGRCSWTVGLTAFFLDNCPVTCKQCVFNKDTVPNGLPLPPILEPLQILVGVWQAESNQPDRFPVKFASGGYKETIEFLVAEVPGFDTPSLNFTATAVSLNDPTDEQHDVGFLWMRPGSTRPRQIGNMITTNTGITVIQEGILDGDEIRFNSTTYTQILPAARNGYLDTEVTRVIKFSSNQLVQTATDSRQSVYTKVYKRIS